MNRRLTLPVLLLVLIASSITPFLFTAQASTGCSAVGGLSGSYDEFVSRSLGSFPFSAGETITARVTASAGLATDPNVIRLAVSGSAGSDATGASTLSFTIPSDGTYNVTVQNRSGWNLTISVSCGAPGSGASSGSPWGGYTDGRLNPDMAENYSLWCLRNNLDVYRAPNGIGELIMSIPLVNIIAMPEQSRRIFTSPTGPIVILRDTTDAFRVTGNNGNNAPGYAEKAFSLYLCSVSNGALPPTPTPTPVPPTHTPTPIPTATSIPDQGSGTLATLLMSLGPTDPSRDSDGDGVRNTLDLCPAVYAPRPLQFGCPDDDGDGLSNPLDPCPNEAGSLQGCPDNDGDGISARYDLCPNYAPPADTPSAYGCLDGDGDGFPNGRYPNGQWMDWCPFNGGQPGVHMFMGCPDPDGDGFLSSSFPGVPAAYYDDCPQYPLPVLIGGECPTTTPQTLQITVNSTTALFLFAAQQGSFDGLYVPAQGEQDAICLSGSYGFCGL